MNELYQQRSRSFAKGLTKARDVISEKKPDILLAPMRGAIPLIDGINVANPYFDNSIVYYMPASSSIKDIKKVMAGTFANILASILDYEIIQSMDGKFLILSIDEVVSGNSAVRVIKAVREGITIFSNKVAMSFSGPSPNNVKKYIRDIKSKIKYQTIAFEHGEFISLGNKRSKEYEKMKKDGLVIPIEVEYILTMDRPEFCPISYVELSDKGETTYTRHLPIIKNSFNITQDYINFLANMASIIGTDPESVCVKNLQKIIQHQEFVPQEFRQMPEL